MGIYEVEENHTAVIGFFAYLSSVLPGNSGEPLNGERAECSQHGPPPMNELALSEPLQPENLAVRLERGRLHVRVLEPGPDHIAGQVLGQVLVQRVEVELQVLRGLAQTERVEPVVPHQAPVQIFWSLGSREPKWAVGDGLCGFPGCAFLASEPESGLDPARVGVRISETRPHEGRCSCSGSGGGHGVGLTCAGCEVSAGCERLNYI
jgi:hypothetical protein